MLNSAGTNVERIIAKIDNDFNPDNSDWIPRVGAWCIDAMATLRVLRRKPKRRRLTVKDRIAMSPCAINTDNFKMYDANGCEIVAMDEAMDCGCYSTGLQANSNTDVIVDISKTSQVIDNPNANNAPDYTVFQTINEKRYPPRYNVYNYDFGDRKKERNYVMIGCDKFELNFDTDCIFIVSDEIETQVSAIYGCEIPVIPNNGFLIEALAAWCMYKMLTRGYQHPIFNLTSNSPALNPYINWRELQEKAKVSIMLDAQGDVIDDGGAWRSAFYINTYDPKRYK